MSTTNKNQPPPLTPDQRSILARLIDDGHKVAVLTNSQSPALAQLGVQLGGILIDDYGDAFPERVASNTAAVDNYATQQQALMATQGPKLWAMLHPRVYTYIPTPGAARREANWLAGLANSIPCGKCRAFYVNHLRLNPPPLPDTDDPRAYFNWTVDLHNAVNAEPELDKPTISYGQAAAQWAPKQPLQ